MRGSAGGEGPQVEGDSLECPGRRELVFRGTRTVKAVAFCNAELATGPGPRYRYRRNWLTWRNSLPDQALGWRSAPGSANLATVCQRKRRSGRAELHIAFTAWARGASQGLKF